MWSTHYKNGLIYLKKSDAVYKVLFALWENINSYKELAYPWWKGVEMGTDCACLQGNIFRE